MESFGICTAYSQENAKYYLDILTKFERGEKITFNFYAAIFGACWLTDRKMYVEFVGFLIVAGMYREVLNMSALQLYIAMFLLAGLGGNFVYMLRAKRVAKHQIVPTSGTLDNDHLNILKKMGGASIVGPIILMILSFVLRIVLK